MHEQRYQSSSTRNADNFLSRGGKVPKHFTGTAPAEVNYAHFAGMEMEDLKHHVGLRKNDSKFDGELSAWLGKVKDHATKNKIAAKSHKKAAPAVVSELKEGQTVLDLSTAVDITPKAVFGPRSQQVSDELLGQIRVEASTEKKVNPKKAQRQAALEASGTAPKKINADTVRAEKMAGMAKRQPRILAKTQH